MKPIKSCGTCALADFWRTPTGRIKKGYCAACRAPLPDAPVMPACITIKFDRHMVWAHQGVDCPAYQARVK